MKTDSQHFHKFFILLLGAAFLSILAVSLAYRVLHPSLVAHIAPQGDIQKPSGMPASEMNAIGSLMRQAAENPDNPQVLMALVENLLGAGQWDAAENFAQKAIALKPDSPDPKLLYLLALAHHNKGEHAQAAEILEKLLGQSENPSARYSLAILYLHYLNKPEAGREELRKGLQIESLSPALARAMREELEKAEKNVRGN